jgi:hypothetical protein
MEIKSHEKVIRWRRGQLIHALQGNNKYITKREHLPGRTRQRGFTFTISSSNKKDYQLRLLHHRTLAIFGGSFIAD